MRIGLVGSANTAMLTTPETSSLRDVSPGAACELYTSEIFRSACQVAQQTCHHGYVLSAQHGLVAPDALITPDTLTIARMRTGARRAWAQGILEGLAAYNTLAPTWLILAPPIYHAYLRPALRGSIALPFDGANGQREMLNQLVRLRASVPTPTAPPKLRASTPAQRAVLAALHSNPQALTRQTLQQVRLNETRLANLLQGLARRNQVRQTAPGWQLA